MESSPRTVEPLVHGFPWRPFVVLVAALFLAVTLLARQYRGEVALPRYCSDPEQTLELLQRVISERRPAGDEARRPYLVAAKLLFLVPRQADEPVDLYLDRVAVHIAEACR